MDPPEHWLDWLPEELCDRIAAHVSGGKQTEDALELAQVSEKHRRSVWHALSKRIIVDLEGNPHKEAQAMRWADVYFDYSIQVKCFRVTPASTSLLSRSCVRRVTITENDALLTPMRGSSSIRELHLSLAWSSKILQLLFETLSTMHITKLSINDGRPFTGNSTADHLCGVLASSCPHLQSLSFDFIRPFPPPQSVWEALRKLPALSDVNVNNKIPSDAIPVLRKLTSVTIHSASPSLASRIGPAVTKYNSLFDEPLGKKDIVMLAGCPRLVSLEVRVDPGVEDDLEQVLKQLPLLETLAINWERYGDQNERVRVEPEPGAILRLVEAAKSLTELRLYNVQISLAEVEAIMQSTGKRLRALLVPIIAKNEDPMERLQSCILTAMKWNFNLRDLFFAMESVDLFPKASNPEIISSWWFYRIEMLTGHLRRHAPFFKTTVAKNVLGPDAPKHVGFPITVHKNLISGVI